MGLGKEIFINNNYGLCSPFLGPKEKSYGQRKDNFLVDRKKKFIIVNKHKIIFYLFI
jgi:hypothetical protein